MRTEKELKSECADIAIREYVFGAYATVRKCGAEFEVYNDVVGGEPILITSSWVTAKNTANEICERYKSISRKAGW